ncbi:uncharacterized protein LOC133498354 [Syngnathoides biaculeatus]|uniref:uncharacterized protein LOC133498354 n=1 Tax=Syngnathoides biaculeatus TaxID=300417 RepID=UPI002ADD81CF|nr:uncharacterized protein LOC133498354 [Syngnathoides biaculeatus]
MSKKTFTKRSLVKLFSRSEPNLDESSGKGVGKKTDEKKRLKLPKLKIRSKGSSSSEKQKVVSHAEASHNLVDGPGWADNMLDKSSSSIYATAPRSKAQKLSHSETDLQKTNKFATFSFGLLKKKKKKKEDNLSRSTFGLHRSDIEEQEEKHGGFRKIVDDQDSRNAKLSMSQPALVTSDNFDIPSPPSIHSKLLQSYFALSQQTPVNHSTKPGPQEHLTSGSDLLLHHAVQNSPSASIPDLQQYDTVQSEEKESIPMGKNQSKSNPTSIHTSVWMTSASSAAETASQPSQLPLLVDASDQLSDEAVDRNLAVTCIKGPDDLQPSNTDGDILIREPTNLLLSHHEINVLDTLDSRSLNGEPSLTYDDANATLLPEPVPNTEQEIEFLHTEQSLPETAEYVPPTLSISNQQIEPPVNQDVIYGALYESLFPQSFTSEILSSRPTSCADVSPETRNQKNKSEPFIVSYFQNETDIYSSQITSGFTIRNDSFSTHSDLPSHQRFYSDNSPPASEAQINSEIPDSYLPSSSHSSTYSYSEQPVESAYSIHINRGNSPGLYEQTLSSVPVASNSAPAVSDYVTSLGVDTQVTDSKQRVILVKEVIAEEKNIDSGHYSSNLHTMTTDIHLKPKMDAADKEFVCSPPPGLTQPFSMPCSPVHLSLGSDDGSTADIYFSAEEDNMDSLDEQTRIMDKIEEESLVCPSEVTNFQMFSPEKETINKIEHFELVNTEIEESKTANKEMENHIDLQDHIEQLLRSRREEFHEVVTGRTEFLKDEDGSIEQIDCVSKGLPQVKEEFLVTPVLQVKTPLVCEFAAPSTCRQGEGPDETWINVNETAGHLNEENQLLNHGLYNLQNGDVQGPKLLLPNSTTLEDEDLSTHEVREEEEKIFPITDATAEESPEHAYTKILTTKCASTESSGVTDVVTCLVKDGAELQSNSTIIEHHWLPQQTEWVDTITQSAGNGTQREQVADELPDLQADRHHPRNDATEELSWKQEQLLEVHDPLKQWSPTAASEAFNANHPKIDADQVSDVKMNSGFSSLSTTLSMKNSPPNKLDESRYRFRKVSLVHPTDSATKQDTVDFSGMESNGTTLGTEYSWTNSFDGASRFVPKEEPIFSDSQSYRLFDTSTSTYSTSFLPEATSYSYNTTSELGRSPTDDTDTSCFTGVFKATLVELDDPAAPASSPPASPDLDGNQFEMDNLKDTLKNMGPSLRPRSLGVRGLPPAPVSALPPIVEDAPSSITSGVMSPTSRMEASTAETQNGVYTLPADLGLKRNIVRDTRSPMELMKKQEQPGARDMPLRASATNRILMRKSSDSSEEHKSLNGNGAQQSPTNSRLENSVIFGSYRGSSLDQTQENSKLHRSVFRTGSLPDFGSSNILKEHSEVTTTTDSSSRFERLSFLLNSSPSSSSFSTGSDDLSTRKSLPPLQSITSSASSSSPSRLLSPTGSLENHRLFPTTESSYSKFGQTVSQGIGTSTLSTPVLQRSFSHDAISPGGQQNLLINNNLLKGSQVHKTEPERNVKYRAFPDAYLTKEKEHGKLNPRPGKMYIFDRPGMCGQRIELRSDVVDATSWELQETISIRVVRGGWVLYEKRNFKGEKIALDEGDIELTCPFQQTEEEGEHQVNGQKVTEEQKDEQNEETNEEQSKTKPARRFIIGSVRRAVRDYSVPEISLFPEENAEGKKVIFRDTSDDARIFGFPIKANSIIIKAGLWLVFEKPFFEGIPRVLEVGGYSNPESWTAEQPYVGSLHPLKVGEPRVENISEPKIEIYERSYFSGKSRIITTNMKDFMTRIDRQQGAFMYSVGSLKVHGGIWVGYEKEGFRGHQYLLEEGEYHDWRVWGGSNSELRSVRVLQADLSEPLMVMFEQPEEEEEGAPAQEENTFEVTEAIPDVELFDYKTHTRSIQVFSGVWVAYSHVDFSGNQYILEKGFYSNCADWGSRDTRICSVQPVRLAPTDGNRTRNEILLYSEPEYKGMCLIFNYKQDAVTEEFQIKSCRIVGRSWVLYENKDFTGTMYVLSEGGYSSLISMGCTPSTFIRSVKAVPMSFSVPSISLFGQEGLEGREITTDSELVSMVAEGFNDHILSIRVNSGFWVLCEFSHYRGRQFLLEPIEITNWPKFSSVQTVGSMYPVRQKRHFFRIRNADSQHYMSIQGGVEEMKSGRVVVTPEVEPLSDIWFYQDGFIKNKLSPTMSLQVMGTIEPAAKLVLWSETRQPSQTWMAQMRGRLSSITFPGMVIDVKGGQSYDKEHVVIMPESDERLSQQWEIVLIN